MSSTLLALRQRKRTCRAQYGSVEFVVAGCRQTATNAKMSRDEAGLTHMVRQNSGKDSPVLDTSVVSGLIPALGSQPESDRRYFSRHLCFSTVRRRLQRLYTTSIRRRTTVERRPTAVTSEL